MKRIQDAFEALQPSDAFDIAHEESEKAVKLFLPSSLPKQLPPQQSQGMPPLDQDLQDAIMAMAMVDKVEGMAARVARGLPPEEPPPDPFAEFGHELHPVHMDAISTAFQNMPEEHRADLITEAHNNIVKWIHSNQGKVVVDGKIHIADDLAQAEKLGQKIVNEAIDNEDQKAQDRDNVTLQNGAGNAQPAPEYPAAAISAGSIRNTASEAGLQVPASASSPEIVPPGDEDKQILKSNPPEVKPEETANIGQVDKESDRQVLQPKESVNDNKKLALDAAPELNAKLQQLTSQIPGTQFSRLRPLKGKDRTDTKVDEGKPPETLSDYLAAQISADSPQAKDQLLALLQKNFNVVDVDDQFLHGREDKAGYPSTNIQVQMSNGMTAEVQIVPKEVQDVSKQSHDFYKAGRDAEVKGDNQERDKQWGEAKKIHDAAMQAFVQRNGISAQPQPQSQGSSADTTPTRPQTSAELPVVENKASTIANQSDSSANNTPEDLLRQSVESAGFKVSSKPFVINGKLFIGVYQDNAANDNNQQETAQGNAPAPMPAQELSVAPAQAVQEPALSQSEAEPEPKYKYASSQINLDQDTSNKIREIADKIPEEDLAGQGKETGAGGHHVTVRYGIESHADLDELKKALSKHAPFEGEFGKTNVFPPTESSEGNAVVHVGVKSPELVDIHKEIGKAVPTTHNDFTDDNYKPHATVAYVKPEAAEKYKGLTDLEGHKFPVNSIHVSNRNGEQIEIPLKGKKELKKGDKVTLKDGRTGTLTYLHPELSAARVKIGNKNVRINSREIA